MTEPSRPTYWHVEGMYLRETLIPGGFQWDVIDEATYVQGKNDEAALVALAAPA